MTNERVSTNLEVTLDLTVGVLRNTCNVLLQRAHLVANLTKRNPLATLIRRENVGTDSCR